MKRAGTIQRFDATDGLGDIQLDDGTVVRFGMSSLREFGAVLPTAGLRVLVGETAPGLRGVLRAKEVFFAGESWDRTWHVFGIETTTRSAGSGSKERVRLLPFDMAAFPRLAEGLAAADLGARAFGPPMAESRSRAAGVLAAIAPLVSSQARRAVGLSPKPGEPDVGSTFVGGSYADVSDGVWPAFDGSPLRHILQIGAREAAQIGLSSQINVFQCGSPAALGAEVLTSWGLAPLFGAMPRGDSPYFVLASKGGTRRNGPDVGLPVLAFGEGEPRTVYPPFDAYRSMDPAIQRDIAAFFADTYVVDPTGYEFAPGVFLRSIQAVYRDEFPDADTLADDLVLGGLAPQKPREKTPRRRLASLSLESLPVALRKLLAQGDPWLAGTADLTWRRWVLDWSEDGAPSAWSYGR
ncbi:MAG: hypothetical protein U0271_03750 [Polyangiaceae bacterium]